MQPGRKYVYLGGPMRGIPLYNFPAFEAGTARLRELGYFVVSPAEIDVQEGYVTVEREHVYEYDSKPITSVELTEKFSIEAALRRDYREITRVDMVVFLPGWENSAGCAGELRVARECGVPVVEYVEEADGSITLLPLAYVEPTATVRRRPCPDCSQQHPISMGCATTEVRVVDPETGGEKGSKLARFDLLPYDALWEVAEQFGRGAEKYADRNWERGYDWGLSHAALHRHLAQFWQHGEAIDHETGGLHLAAVAWHALALLAFQLREAGTDTRPGTLGQA